MKTLTKIIPDIELEGIAYFNDKLSIYVTKKKVSFFVYVDGTGNEFEIDRKKLKEMI